MKEHTHQTLSQIIALLIALLLFTVGRFGFFDILGFKRIIELFIFLPLTLIGIVALFGEHKKWLNPFFLLPFSYLIVVISWDLSFLPIADLMGSLMVIAIILALGKNFSTVLLKYLIRIATFFAMLGLLEFIIVLFNPIFAKKIILFYDYYSGSTVPVIENFLQLLGLADGTSYHLWGMSVTRLRSFASEPSLLVGYFLVPGALALTFRGKLKLYGMICIVFSVSSLAGSVFVSLCFTLIACSLIFLKNRTLLMIFPWVVLIIFIWVLNHYYNELISINKITGGSYDFLDKTNSANIRFSYIRDFLPKILSSPFGLHQEILQPLGLILGSMARGGVFGLVISLVILFNFYSSLSTLMLRKHMPYLSKIGFCVIYGALTAGILYLDNCFIQLYGFTLLLLTYNRLQQLLYENNILSQM